jgi:hypothetical protein
MPSVTDFTKSLLAVLMWREDGADGILGMTAVGLVIRNRVQAGWGDWIQVMSAHALDIGKALVPWPGPDTNNPRFRAVLALADTIFDGVEGDITDGALYYANLSDPELSQWFRENILAKPDAHRRLGTVGQRTFFA